MSYPYQIKRRVSSIVSIRVCSTVGYLGGGSELSKFAHINCRSCLLISPNADVIMNHGVKMIMIQPIDSKTLIIIPNFMTKI